MSRKNTVWCARDIAEQREIERIIEYYSNALNIAINKLEASAIMAEKSRCAIWGEREAREVIKKLRGL
jgi:hypothetical protein